MPSSPTALALKIPPPNIEPWLSQAQSSIASQLAAVNATQFTVNPTRDGQQQCGLRDRRGSGECGYHLDQRRGVSADLDDLDQLAVTVPLANGTNNLNVVGRGPKWPADHRATATVSVSSTTEPMPSPVGQVVINEIMYNPVGHNAQFVELYNNSTNIDV